jgi:hypothetical protein
MPPRHDLDHDPPVLEPLDGLVPCVNAEFLTDTLLQGDLSALSDPTGDDMNSNIRYE